jgi:hypothetical protein
LTLFGGDTLDPEEKLAEAVRRKNGVTVQTAEGRTVCLTYEQALIALGTIRRMDIKTTHQVMDEMERVGDEYPMRFVRDHMDFGSFETAARNLLGHCYNI